MKNGEADDDDKQAGVALEWANVGLFLHYNIDLFYRYTVIYIVCSCQHEVSR